MKSTWPTRLNAKAATVLSDERTLMPSKKALYTAAQCWCDPRVGDRGMDSELATVFAEKLDDYIYALAWCSASDDFHPDGKAREGWEKIVKPLLEVTK